MVRENLPDLSSEERILIGLESMEIGKEEAKGYLIDHNMISHASKYEERLQESMKKNQLVKVDHSQKQRH